ncbi:MAG: 50S ribosomal protein L4 [Candidatus Micrarchaeota archaeon]
MAKAAVYSSEGKKISEATLPKVFEEEIREDLIKRAAISDQTKLYQPKGSDVWAGVRTSAKYRGRKDDYGSLKNQGGAMLPREVLPNGKHGKVRRIPSSVKGRRAHPPKAEKVIVERINKREYAKALRSAMAATASSAAVSRRGHAIGQSLQLPIILDNSADSISKTSDARKMFEAIGVSADMQRAKKTKTRTGTGVGARRGGKKRPKSLLLVVSDSNSKLAHAARNLAGFDVVCASKLKVLDLAPGTKPGRLAAYTTAALELISKG